MSSADVRDMLDLPAEGQPRPHKKQKVVEKRPGKKYASRNLFFFIKYVCVVLVCKASAGRKFINSQVKDLYLIFIK